MVSANIYTNCPRLLRVSGLILPLCCSNLLQFFYFKFNYMLNSNYSIIPKQINQDNNLDSMAFGITKDQYYFISSFNVNPEFKFSKNCTWAYHAISDPNSQPKLLSEINNPKLNKAFNFVLQIADYTLVHSRFVVENQWVDGFLSNFESRTGIQAPSDEEIFNILMNGFEGF